MANRRLSSRRIKTRRSYSVREAAKALGASEATIRAWAASGLHAVADVYPAIFRGVDIIDFLKRRDAGRRKPCGPGRLFCFRCKEPKPPAFDEVEFHADGPQNGTLTGLCPVCATTMKRRTSLVRMRAAAADLKVTIRCADSRLSGIIEPSCNAHNEGT